MKNYLLLSLLLFISIENLSAQNSADIFGTWIGSDMNQEIVYTIRKDSVLVNNLSQEKIQALAIIKIIPETKEKEGRIIVGPDENKKYLPIWFRKRNPQVLAISSAMNYMFMMGDMEGMTSPEKAEAYVIAPKVEEGKDNEKKILPVILLPYWEKKYYDKELMKLPDFPLNDKQAFLKVYTQYADLIIEKLTEAQKQNGGKDDPSVMMSLLTSISQADIIIQNGFNPSQKSMNNFTQTQTKLRLDQDADFTQLEESYKKKLTKEDK